ncbi:murein hydrolase activator NlpD [Enterobacteriaceae bacterium LUAb1]
MSTGSSVCKRCRTAAAVLVFLGLAGCSSDKPPAPISSVNDSSHSGHTGMLQGGNTGRAPSSGSSYGLPARPVITGSSTAAPQNIITENGHIVYNRSYHSIPKGSYNGETYTVKHGDTLFYIAWITGNDFRDLAQRNHILAPYSLNVGQQLQVTNSGGATITGGNAITAADANQNAIQNKPGIVAQQPIITYSEHSDNTSSSKLLPSSGENVATTTTPVTTPTISSTTTSSIPVSSWRWPTDGKIIDSFSASEGGNKGIDIAGSRGQPVVATASGRVVYAGNALRGYGNLIIIKHNDDYLSAYAHNDTMLVREQQEVKVGQKIATMGSTGTSSVRLHFEIRYKGKSVNPLRYLPQR